MSLTTARRAALQRIPQASASSHRALHMTLPAPSPSTWLVSDLRTGRYLPRALNDLKAECRRRQLSIAGTKTDLADRLSADDLTANTRTTRSFSTTTPTQFNTTRALKAPKDTSTIDFTFLPDMDVSTQPDLGRAQRRMSAFTSTPPLVMPFLPQGTRAAGAGAAGVDAASVQEIIRPEISTVAHVSTHSGGGPSAMEDVLDNGGVAYDPSSVMESVKAATSAKAGSAGEAVVTIKKVWDGLVDDVFGGAAGQGKGTVA
ncbi:MAG: hypothetical protein M4579_007201 [Chaenotheca gracillima]|nr:MAG: hypothetical protein M4579_007201 [Chaenotheca gracillima]